MAAALRAFRIMGHVGGYVPTSIPRCFIPANEFVDPPQGKGKGNGMLALPPIPPVSGKGGGMPPSAPSGKQ